MSDLNLSGSDQPRSYNDGAADALASVAIMVIVIAAVVFWLSGL